MTSIEANDESACDMFLRRMKEKRASIPDPIPNPTETVNDIFDFFEDLFDDFCGRFIPRSFFPNEDDDEDEGGNGLLEENRSLSPILRILAIQGDHRLPSETESTLFENTFIQSNGQDGFVNDEAMFANHSALDDDDHDAGSNSDYASTNSGENELFSVQQQSASTSKRSLPPQEQATQPQQQAKRIKRQRSVESQPPTSEVNDDSSIDLNRNFESLCNWECSVTDCRQKCATQAELEIHAEFGHDWGQMYFCEEPGCMYLFVKMDNLFDHHRRIHTTGHRPFKCTEEGCGCAFTDIFGLDVHQRLHIGLLNV